MSVSLDDVVARIDDLPSLPAVVMELLSCADNEETDIAVLARKVSQDQALTAKTLRLSNSSLVGLQVRITTIQQAITYLGFQCTRNLITAAALTGCFAREACQGFDHKAFWRHSIGTAVCARIIARHLRFNQDYAFTAGLLHDIGRLVLVSVFPGQYAQVLVRARDHHAPLLAAERAVFGETDHVTAGVALAEHWKFSEVMKQAIAFHHAPEAQDAGLLAAIVHLADGVVHALDLAGEPDELVPVVSPAAWSTLALDEAAWLQLFRETELQFSEISAVLMS